MASTKPVLAQRVTCQLCLKPYVDPRILPCLHSFCQKCLHDEILKACSPERRLQCPSCRLNVTVPVGGAGAFPQNLHLGFEVEVFVGYVAKMEGESAVPCDCCVTTTDNPAVAFCCTCCEFLCVVCKDFHKRARRLLQHTVLGLGKESATLLPSLLKPGDVYCLQPDHGENKLKFYCEACCCLICHDCTVLNHKGHRCVDMATVANAQREEMREAVQHTGEALTKLDRAIDANKGMVEQVEATKQNCESVINRSFDELHKTLEHRRKTLLSELETIFLSKMTALALQEEQFEKMQHDIGHHTEAISHILQTHSDHEVLTLGGQIPKELKVILSSVETFSLVPNTHSSVALSVQNTHFVNELSRFGHLADLRPSPCKSVWTSKCVAKKDRAYHAQVVTMSATGEPYPFGNLKVKAELRSTGAIPGEVEDHRDGTYTITITPKKAGPHQLHITMDDQHLMNSPHHLEVKSWDYRTLRDANQVISVSKPWCVAVHQSGDIYVGSDDSCIYVFDQTGNSKGTIGSHGNSSGQFESPRGIAMNGDVIYVADWGNHRIQKLTIQGGFLHHMFGAYGVAAGQLRYPYAAMVDAKERLVVSENSNYRVQVFDQDGKSLQIIPGKDTGIPMQEFNIPWGLALDPQGNIHVASNGLNTVKVYTPQGIYVRTYGDALSKPTGIAIDDEGFCIVCERQGNCLTIFDAQGNRIHSISTGVSSPCGVSLSPDGSSLYVANFADNNVLKYCL